MRTKFRTLAVTLMTAFCMTLFCVPAFAMSEEPAQSTTSPAEATTPADAETGTSSNPFTPNGTGTVVDNATDEDGKEFYTIQTADENVFYLVIDKQRGTENVYFLNAVTKATGWRWLKRTIPLRLHRSSRNPRRSRKNQQTNRHSRSNLLRLASAQA